MEKRNKNIRNDIYTRKVTPSYYTVYVSNFPKYYKESELKSHFNKIGLVSEVNLVRDYGGTMFMHKKENDIRY